MQNFRSHPTCTNRNLHLYKALRWFIYILIPEEHYSNFWRKGIIFLIYGTLAYGGYSGPCSVSAYICNCFTWILTYFVSFSSCLLHIPFCSYLLFSSISVSFLWSSPSAYVFCKWFVSCHQQKPTDLIWAGHCRWWDVPILESDMSTPGSVATQTQAYYNRCCTRKRLSWFPLSSILAPDFPSEWVWLAKPVSHAHILPDREAEKMSDIFTFCNRRKALPPIKIHNAIIHNLGNVRNSLKMKGFRYYRKAKK